MFLLFLGTIVLLLCGAILFIRLALVVVTVECQSMSPSLESGDRVLVCRSFPTRWLRKGQIVIAWPYTLPTDGAGPFGVPQAFIKRIVAMPNESITTSIDELQESIRAHEQAAYDSSGQRKWDVPAEHVFVQGDHPGAVADSRVWGPIPIAGVLGVVIMQLSRRPSEAIPQTVEIENLPPEVRSYLKDHTDLA